MASEEVLSRFAMEESPSLVNRRYAGPFGGSSCGLVVRRMVEIVVSTGSTSNFRSGNAVSTGAAGEFCPEIVVSTGSTSNFRSENAVSTGAAFCPENVVSTGSTNKFRSGNAFPIDIRGTEGDRISNGLRPEAWCERI